MSNSDLATVHVDCTGYARTAPIDTITIHHAAAVGVSALQIGQELQRRCVSANYGIGVRGEIGLFVPEEKRAITSNSSANDNRAITIEVANSAGAPDWPISSASWSSLILLLVDVCRRNKIPELRWRGDPKLIGKTDQQNMTVHKWFAATACPGDYLMSRMGEIAEAVNARLAPPFRYNRIDELPEWAKPTIRKLVMAGVLEGKTDAVDEDGLPAALDLSEDMLRLLVLNDRAGVYDGVKIEGGIRK